MDTLLPVLVDADDEVPQVVSQTKMNDQVTGFVHQVMRVYKNFCGYSEIITKKGVPHETRTGSV